MYAFDNVDNSRRPLSKATKAINVLCIIIKVNDALFTRIGYFKEITSKTNQGTTYTTLNCKTIILKIYL